MTGSPRNGIGSPPAFLFFDGMTWPNPDALGELQQRLTYGEPTRGDLMLACSAIRAYAQLVSDPHDRRNAKVRGIRKAAVSSRSPRTGDGGAT